MTTNSSIRINQYPLANNVQNTDWLPVITNPTNNNAVALQNYPVSNLFSNADLIIKTSTPANSTANAVVNSIWFDNNYIYVCVGNNYIKRVALNSF